MTTHDEKSWLATIDEPIAETTAPVLRHERGSLNGTETPLAGDTWTLGRKPDCDVPFDAHVDVGVSGVHARLRRSGGALTIEDLGSANGTHVNGAPIAGVTRLADGDRVELGGTTTKGSVAFRVVGGEAAAPSAAPGGERDAGAAPLLTVFDAAPPPGGGPGGAIARLADRCRRGVERFGLTRELASAEQELAPLRAAAANALRELEVEGAADVDRAEGHLRDAESRLEQRRRDHTDWTVAHDATRAPLETAAAEAAAADDAAREILHVAETDLQAALDGPQKTLESWRHGIEALGQDLCQGDDDLATTLGELTRRIAAEAAQLTDLAPDLKPTLSARRAAADRRAVTEAALRQGHDALEEHTRERTAREGALNRAERSLAHARAAVTRVREAEAKVTDLRERAGRIGLD